MKLAALDRKMLRDLWRLKGQLFAIGLVIASGISTFVAMLSTLDSLERAMETYYQRQRFADVFVALVRAPERVARKLSELPDVGAIESRVVADVSLDVPGTVEAVSGRLVSIPDFGEPRLNGLHLRLGRLPESGSDDQVLVSEAFAEAHGLLPSDTLTAIINGRRERLRVVGIALSPEFTYSIKPGSMIPDDRLFGVMWMRRKALATAFDMDGAFNNVSLALTHGADTQALIDQVDRLLARYGGLGAYPRRDQESNWFLENEIVQLRNTGLFMPIVFLLVASFLLNIVLMRMVSGQREQIAVLKAFGYSNRRVGLHYLQLVLVVVVLAGILGAAGGAWMGNGLVALYASSFRFPELAYDFDPRYLIQALAIGAVAALIGTTRAIREAVRLPPAEAMRPLSPPLYRATLVERLGLDRWLRMPARMVLRAVERRPGRAALSVLGIGCGAALLVVGNSFVDSMEHGIDVQFRVAQREDATVNLVEPRSMRAFYEIDRLPAVREAEPFRATAVRLRSGHRSRRTALIGLPVDADLQRLVDSDARPVSIPEEGLVLNATLAGLLRVGEGDELVVEVLEGRRPVLAVPVASVVESFFGLGAHMSLEALNRLLGEGPTISGAYLLTDGARMERLHDQLKLMPSVAAVGLRKEMLRNFRETAAEHMWVMSLFMFLFAIVIACGVVYNNARMILAERSRELASMRVLGYRRAEISWILLGELWLLTAVALPVGLGLGYLLARWVIAAADTELYRLPFAFNPQTYAVAALVVGVASIASGLLVRRQLDRLDLIEVLKERE